MMSMGGTLTVDMFDYVQKCSFFSSIKSFPLANDEYIIYSSRFSLPASVTRCLHVVR